MSEFSRNNKFLIVQAKVVLTPIIDPVIVGMDHFFEQAGIKALVTSGLRTPEDQLNVIRKYLVEKGIDHQYPQAMTCEVADRQAWQLAWSDLLNRGLIINPPIPAVCLMDYYRNDGINRKGKLIGSSPHIRGIAFDIGGGGNGILDELAVVAGIADGELPGFVSYLAERENNCCHINCTA